MAMVFLMGYRPLDFHPQDDPTKTIKGFNLFLGVSARDTLGVVPVSDGGKRFIGERLAQDIGVTKKFLDDNLYDFINLDIDFNGKIIDCAALTDDQKNSAEYPFSGSNASAVTESGSKFPF